MNAADHAILSTSIKLMKELEELIISKARPVFKPQVPYSNDFDVIISKTREVSNEGEISDVYEARLIAYTGGPDAPHGEWMLLLANRSLCKSPIDALADLLEDLYQHVGQSVVGNGAAVGATYNGVWKASSTTPEI
ncbi:hypothetical protein E8E12_000475 [Didymella heteroderae]|uniref:Uncharacterized protein n=1 Tax=Didymella heteroderae TaxID=1769908 RepID=A0A9P4WVP9_9PLEO|nr:hypothetical protein E8E12_000475 [Didymella heteroderae]